MENYKIRLKEIREDNDMLQKNVAGILGISQQQYSRYESGEREMPLHHLVKLCKYYGVSSDYLLGLPKGLKWYR